MGYFYVNSEVWEHGKMQTAMHLAGNEVASLWIGVGLWCSRYMSRGVVPLGIPPLIGRQELMSDAKRAKAVEALVDVGIWHHQDDLPKCERCVARGLELPRYAYLWHDFQEDEPTENTSKARFVRRKTDDCREEVLARFGSACVVCGATEPLHVDHIHPVSRGGGNDLANLTVLCGPCNNHKRAKTWQEWMGVTFDAWMDGVRA